MPAARRMKVIKTQTATLTKQRRGKLPQTSFGLSTVKSKSKIRRLQFSISCPHLGTLFEPTGLIFRPYSSIGSNLFIRVNSLQRISHSSNNQAIKRTYTSCNAGCPCPFPCGPYGCKSGCCCLPPPCNTPPKCLQYMTGYYYYPYGTWFCGPYHVSGTCTPVGAGCPCPCPVKCCPACVCPAANLASNKNVSDISQFPVEMPCHTMPKINQEARGSMSKVFHFGGSACAKKEPQEKPKPSGIPPTMSTLMCVNPFKQIDLMDREPRIKNSYPTMKKPKSRFYHTESNSMTAGSSLKVSMCKQKNVKSSCFQTQNNTTPLERARIFLKESKTSPRTKLNSLNNTKRHDPRPEVDIEIKPYRNSRGH